MGGGGERLYTADWRCCSACENRTTRYEKCSNYVSRLLSQFGTQLGKYNPRKIKFPLIKKRNGFSSLSAYVKRKTKWLSCRSTSPSDQRFVYCCGQHRAPTALNYSPTKRLRYEVHWTPEQVRMWQRMKTAHP